MNPRDSMRQQITGIGSSLALLVMLPGLCLGKEPATSRDPSSNRSATATDMPAEDSMVPAALFEFIGEFSDTDTDWIDPTELDDWMLESLRTPEDRILRSSTDLEQDAEPDEH